MAVPHPSDHDGPPRRTLRTTVSPSALDTTDGAFRYAPNDRPTLHVRLFGSVEFFRLWLVQLVGATGDWLGIFAVIYLAQELYPEESNARAAATSLVVGVRILPHLFLSPLVGVLVDRFSRRKLMVIADLARVPVLLVIPFFHNLVALVAASVVLEAFTLLWTPSKDAITPHLVPHDHLTTANSLNMAAGFGAFLPGSVMFALLAGLSTWLARFPALASLADNSNQTVLPLLFDAATFLFSAAVIWRLRFPEHATHASHAVAPAGGAAPVGGSGAAATGPGPRVLAGAWASVREGWRYAFVNPTVRAVNVSLAVALVGGGMLVPLGAIFATEALDAGAAGYGLFTTAIGFGVAVGMAAVSAVQKRLPKGTLFAWGLVAAGTALVLAVTATSLSVSVPLLFVVGATAGPVYVLGYSILHENVTDAMRGRVFAGLNTLVRVCMFLALVLGPLLAAAFDSLSQAVLGDRRLEVGGVSYEVPGVRLTLWLDGALIVAAGFVASRALHRPATVRRLASEDGGR